jgi:hypothetical protein
MSAFRNSPVARVGESATPSAVAEQAGSRGLPPRDLGMPAGYDRDRHRIPEGANQANVDSRSDSGPKRKRRPVTETGTTRTQ